MPDSIVRLTKESSKVQTLLAQTFTWTLLSELVLLAGTSTSTPSHQHFLYTEFKSISTNTYTTRLTGRGEKKALTAGLRQKSSNF
jgi:hypothetical protein